MWFLPSQGNGEIEDRQHQGASVISEQVPYDGGRDGGVAGFTDAHQPPGEHKQPVVLQRGGEKNTCCYNTRQGNFLMFTVNNCLGEGTGLRVVGNVSVNVYLSGHQSIFQVPVTFHLPKKTNCATMVTAHTTLNHIISHSGRSINTQDQQRLKH